MQAKIKPNYRWNSLIAFAGCEFVKTEYRPIPKEFENAALAHESLEIELAQDKKESTHAKTRRK